MPDTLALDMGRPTSPALSTTSDMPKASAPAPEQSTGSEVDAEAKTDKLSDTGAEKPTGETPPKPKADETPPAVKREITIERNRRREAEAKAAKAEADLSEALKALNRQAPKAEAHERKPQRDAYDDPEAYDEALIQWAEKEAAGKAEAKVKADQAKSEAQAAVQKTVEMWNERKDAFAKDHPDFEEVAESEDTPISRPMGVYLMEAEDGPQLAYWLGQNREEAARIAKLSPVKAVAELGRIAERLANPTPKAQPKPKPEPIKPVGGRSSATPKDPSEESMEEYGARRLAELRARK
jgi:hypothetical protein